MNLHLRYYLHKLLPWLVAKPYVLVPNPRTIQEARIESARYTVSAMRKQDIELYLKRLTYENIAHRQVAWMNGGYDYTVTIDVEGFELSRLQNIQIPDGVAVQQKAVTHRDALVVTSYTKKDWSPKDAKPL